MNSTGSLFSQVLSLFQRSDFARHVRALKAEHGAKGFKSWDQFVAMLFCQLAQARSLRKRGQPIALCDSALDEFGAGVGRLWGMPRKLRLQYPGAMYQFQIG